MQWDAWHQNYFINCVFIYYLFTVHKERLQLYFFSPSVPSWPVMRWPLPLPVTTVSSSNFITPNARKINEWIWKESDVAQFKVPSRHFSGRTQENQEIVSDDSGLQAEIWTQNSANKKQEWYEIFNETKIYCIKSVAWNLKSSLLSAYNII